MEYSRLRDEKAGSKFRLITFAKHTDFNDFFEDKLVDLEADLPKQKNDFKFLVENFDKMDEKQFFIYYAKFYVWDNDKLDIYNLPILAQLTLRNGSMVFSEREIELIYQDAKDVFTKIKSEFNKDILDNDYEKYCEAQQNTLEKVASALKEKRKESECEKFLG